MASPPFNPSAWYWIVAGSITQVYSSAAVAYVPVSDANYQAWVARGYAPTRIATEQDLWDVLIARGIAGPAGAAASDALKTQQVNGLDTVTLKILFNHENRIRALEGKQAITAAQFANAIKSLL
jgi:hypothetical protein